MLLTAKRRLSWAAIHGANLAMTPPTPPPANPGATVSVSHHRTPLHSRSHPTRTPPGPGRRPNTLANSSQTVIDRIRLRNPPPASCKSLLGSRVIRLPQLLAGRVLYAGTGHQRSSQKHQEHVFVGVGGRTAFFRHIDLVCRALGGEVSSIQSRVTATTVPTSAIQLSSSYPYGQLAEA